MTSEPDTPDTPDTEELPPEIMAIIEESRKHPERRAVWIRPRQHGKSEAFAEMVRISEEAGFYDGPQMRVCLTHKRINICRQGAREGGCEWSTEPADLAAIQAYHGKDPE